MYNQEYFEKKGLILLGKRSFEEKEEMIEEFIETIDDEEFKKPILAPLSTKRLKIGENKFTKIKPNKRKEEVKKILNRKRENMRKYDHKTKSMIRLVKRYEKKGRQLDLVRFIVEEKLEFYLEMFNKNLNGEENYFEDCMPHEVLIDAQMRFFRKSKKCQRSVGRLLRSTYKEKIEETEDDVSCSKLDEDRSDIGNGKLFGNFEDEKRMDEFFESVVEILTRLENEKETNERINKDKEEV